MGDVVVQYDPGHAALPWAAIRLIMQATVNDTAVFGHVATSIEDVTNVISTCAVLELRYLRQEASMYLSRRFYFPVRRALRSKC